MLQGRSADGEIWRRSATELGEVGVGVALRALWSTARLGVTLWMHCRGQGELKNTDGVEIAVAEVFTGRRKSGAMRAELGQDRIGRPPGGSADLLRDSRRAVVRRRGEAER